MKRNYNQPLSMIEAIDTADLLQALQPSDWNGIGQEAPARQFAPSKQYK